MKSKVVLLTIIHLLVSVSASPAGNPEETNDSSECQDLKIFEIPMVDCSSEGITVNFKQLGSLETELVVDGYRNISVCGKNYTAGENEGTFTVTYDTCGVKLINNTAEFNLVVLRPPRQIRKSAQIRPIKCEYPLKQDASNKSFQVGDLRTVTDLPSTSITVPDPTHMLKIMNSDSEEIEKAEPGEPLTGKLCISPKSYFGSLKNCYLAPDQNDNSSRHEIVNEAGCPTDQDVSLWSWNSKNHCIQLPFKAFKLLDWKENHLFCQVHYCTQERDCAPPSNCPEVPKPCKGPKPKQ